jgi:membrane associated rhomboid family serine protease
MSADYPNSAAAARLRHALSPSTIFSALGNYLNALPILSIVLASWFIIVYIVDSFTSTVLGWQTAASTLGLWPSKVFEWQLYRLITYPWVHLGIGHLLLNLSVVIPLISLLETTIGTLQTLYLLFIPFSLLPSLAYLALSLGDSGLHETIVVGSSGWAFTLIVWEAKRYGSRQ